MIAEMTLVPVDRQMDMHIVDILTLHDMSIKYAIKYRGWQKA
jgi:hypothetical protein